MPKQPKKKVKDGEAAVKRRHHRKQKHVDHTSRPDASDPAVKLVIARNKLDACWHELNQKAETLPTKSRVLLVGNMQGIREDKPIRLPSIMPECDKTDIYNSLKWYRHLWLEWRGWAEAVEKRYGK